MVPEKKSTLKERPTRSTRRDQQCQANSMNMDINNTFESPIKKENTEVSPEKEPPVKKELIKKIVEEKDESIRFRIELSTKKGSKFVSECGIREDTFVVSPVGRRNTLKLGDSKGDAYDFSSVLAKEESPLKKWLKQGKYTY